MCGPKIRVWEVWHCLVEAEQLLDLFFIWQNKNILRSFLQWEDAKVTEWSGGSALWGPGATKDATATLGHGAMHTDSELFPRNEIISKYAKYAF